ncbi:pectate lyase, partial [Marasmius fiardii PR-910]
MLNLSLFVAILLLTTISVFADDLRVALNPAGIPGRVDPDWPLWTITNGQQNTSTVISGVTFTLQSSSDTTLKGGQYKLVRASFNGFLGEHMIGEGMSTDSTTGSALSLTIQGLSVGTHSILSWHNAWDALTEVAGIDITVDGTKVISNKAQTIRQDNIWTATSTFITFNITSPTQPITFTYQSAESLLSDRRAYLNGFEIDPPGNIANQASFPLPEHGQEHADGDSGSLTASWSGIPNATYDVYFSDSGASGLKLVSGGQSNTSFTFTGLSSMGTYTWRVDVVAPGSTMTTGRNWMFRTRQLAFPGAEGYGKYARGGRGGQVVKVTKLEDDGSEGTLRWALTNLTGPRTVVFDIGGVITLSSRLTINQNYITLAGQTAPGKGIVVTNQPFGLSGAQDVILRHIRVRPGKASGDTVDGMGMQGSNHCIFDRCSMGWSIDESFSSRSAFNITLQRSMISEPLNVAGHKNYPPGTAHGYAASIGGDIGSFHHNLIAHAEGRSWSMAGGVDNAAFFAGRLDMRNNVVYNFGDRVTDGGSHQANFVNNFYKPGPASTRNYDLEAQYEDNLPGTQTYYCSGNAMLGKFNATAEQVVNTTDTNPIAPCFARVTIDPAPTYQKFFDQPFWNSLVETHTANEAYKHVLSDSGAQTPSLDDHDKRIINETLTNNPTFKGSVTGLPGLIDSETDVGGLEPYPTVTRGSTWDTNNDGIADWWDGSNGGNDGWTALDGTFDLTYFAAGFVEPRYTVKASGQGQVSV